MSDDPDVQAAVSVLTRAAKRIGEGRWSRLGLARTGRGVPCPSTDERAVRWSLLGAIHLELDERHYGRHKEDRVYSHVLDALERARPGWRTWHEQPGTRAVQLEGLAKQAARKLRKEQP